MAESISLGAVVYSAVKPIVKIYILMGLGAFLARRNILTVDTARNISDMILSCILPCLMFNEVVGNIAGSDIKNIGVICFVACLLFSVGGLIAFTVSRLTPCPRVWIGGILSVGLFPNISDLPIAYIQTLDNGKIFTSAEGSKGVAYIIIFLAIQMFCQFNLGAYRLIERDFRLEAQLNNEHASDASEIKEFAFDATGTTKATDPKRHSSIDVELGTSQQTTNIAGDEKHQLDTMPSSTVDNEVNVVSIEPRLTAEPTELGQDSPLKSVHTTIQSKQSAEEASDILSALPSSKPALVRRSSTGRLDSTGPTYCRPKELREEDEEPESRALLSHRKNVRSISYSANLNDNDNNNKPPQQRNHGVAYCDPATGARRTFSIAISTGGSRSKHHGVQSVSSSGPWSDSMSSRVHIEQPLMSATPRVVIPGKSPQPPEDLRDIISVYSGIEQAIGSSAEVRSPSGAETTRRRNKTSIRTRNNSIYDQTTEAEWGSVNDSNVQQVTQKTQHEPSRTSRSSSSSSSSSSSLSETDKTKGANKSTRLTRARDYMEKRHLLFLFALLENFLRPASFTLIVAVIIAMIPWCKALFVKTSHTVYMPSAPDGNPPLSFVMDFTAYLGAAAVPMSLLLLGATISRLTVKSIPPGFQFTALGITVGRLIVMPVFGILVMHRLHKIGWVDNNMLYFITLIDWGLPNATSLVYLTAFYTDPRAKTHVQMDCLAICLLFQYPVLFLSMPFVVTFVVKVVMGM